MKAPSVRTAVIVAAGKGTRLVTRADDRPKPLRPVVGVPLIGRVMHAALRAGIERFVVVIGHRADEMRAHVPALAPEGATQFVENPRFEEPNGVSLALAAERLDEPFALLMADHLFAPERLRAAIAHYETHERNLLVVEDAATFTGDLDDATLVRRDGTDIVAIDKHLEGYDAVDTGMFVLEPHAIRDALARAGPSPSISDGARALTAQRALEALALPAGGWQDVDTPADVEAAERMLYASLRKQSDGFLARHVNRRISLAISTRIWRLGVTPNLATLATLLVGLAAGWAFAVSGAPFWGLLGATLFQFQSILDGVDGELARLLHKESRFGFWLDVTCDNLTHMAVFGGIALGQAADGVPGPWPMLGILAVAGVAASFLVTAPLLRGPARLAPGPAGGALAGLADGLARRDFTYLLFPLAALGWLGGFLWAAAIGTWAYAAIVWGLRRRARHRTVPGGEA